MPAVRHAGLAAGRWGTLSLLEQLANVGSEVERAFRARDDSREERASLATDRALELFDLTAADDRWRGARRREVLRAREYFCRCWFGADAAPDDPAFLRRYFLQFAVAARSGRS